MSASSSPNPAVQGALLDACVRPRAGGPAATVEKAFSVPFVAELALKEKQIQQNVRPVIAVHKWFARRPGTLFRAILLSEFAAPPLPAAYFDPHRLHGVRVADPFMGGGTPLLEANRLGCDVFGWDVNPMAFWVVRQGIEHLDLAAYETTARRLGDVLEDEYLSDLVRYQNMACRYDARALKSLDVFSVHGFPVGLVQCESNLLGIRRRASRANVGSGGWSNIVEKFLKAKQYCEQPFEIRYEGKRKRVVRVPGEWIGERRNGDPPAARRAVRLHAASSTDAALPDRSLDAVLTDPPYFANVQYAELMDFCYVWLRRLVTGEKAFVPESTRNPAELTGNVTLNRDLNHFTEGLSAVYRRMEKALKRGRPFVFTYHHNALDAYYPIAVALLDAGMACTASLPCPAEMGGSIHIHGTESSIVDTVFVCRSTGRVARAELAEDTRALAGLVTRDVGLLREGGVRVTRGDARCVAYGHLTRLAVWRLRGDWKAEAPTAEKLGCVGREVEGFGGWNAVEQELADDLLIGSRHGRIVRESAAWGAATDDDVSF